MKILHSNQGFSLLEVVIALAIFSISIIALYTIQTRTISQNATASRIMRLKILTLTELMVYLTKLWGQLMTKRCHRMASIQFSGM